jgi:ubiquinone biosynthesis protein
VSHDHNLHRNRSTTARTQEIVRVMVKYGFSEWVRMLRLDRAVPGIRRLTSRRGRPPVPEGASRWEIVRLALEELGPTFIKLGQLMSNRSDILPDELTRELSHLQDNVPPIPDDKVTMALREEVGGPLETIFREIDEHPTASASIAQVHKARLVTGQTVAVKIKRPGIAEVIEQDLEILAFLARLAERHIHGTRFLRPTAMVRQLRKLIRRELDFQREQQNMEQFRKNFGRRDHLRVPATYPQYCTRSMLVMEWMDGSIVSSVLSDPDRPHKVEFDRAEVAALGADLMLEQILVHGFFHADPHPGNIMLLPDNTICFLDFGLVGRLNDDEKDQLTAAIAGMAERDGGRVTDAILKITRSNPGTEYNALLDEVQELVDDYLDRSLQDMDIGELFRDLIALIVSHGLSVPSSLMMVAKALLTIEGVGLGLHPEFTLKPALERVTRKAVLNRFKPEALLKDAGSLGLEYLDLARSLPGDATSIARQLRSGQLTLGFRLRGLEPLRQTIDTIGYRLVFGIVLAALLISSALIVLAGLPPLWNGIPLIGLAGFGIAGLLGLGFLFSLITRVFRKH